MASIPHKISWCEPLRKLVDYEHKNGRMMTLATYHPMAFDLLMPLNCDIPSIYGSVDVDWMFRVAPVSAHPGMAYSAYGAAKTFWNTAKGVAGLFTGRPEHKFNYGSVFQEGNRNAPKVAHLWMTGGQTLWDIFEPALDFLEEHCSEDCIVDTL